MRVFTLHSFHFELPLSLSLFLFSFYVIVMTRARFSTHFTLVNQLILQLVSPFAIPDCLLLFVVVVIPVSRHLLLVI